jgi:ribosome biogenesis protein MAK21
MKAVVVREVTALILRPPTAPTPSTANASASHPTSTAAGPSKHIRFQDDSTTPAKPKPKAKKASKKPPPVGNSHARYYAAITFNQIVLTPGDREVALQLMDVYFEMFREILGVLPVGKENDGDGDEPPNDKEVRVDKKGRVVDKGKKSKGTVSGDIRGEAGFVEVEDTHSKLVSAILTGINRAVPFAKIDASDARYVDHQRLLQPQLC